MTSTMVYGEEKFWNGSVVFKLLCIYVVAMIVYSKDKKEAAKATSLDVCW